MKKHQIKLKQLLLEAYVYIKMLEAFAKEIGLNVDKIKQGMDE